MQELRGSEEAIETRCESQWLGRGWGWGQRRRCQESVGLRDIFQRSSPHSIFMDWMDMNLEERGMRYR